MALSLDPVTPRSRSRREHRDAVPGVRPAQDGPDLAGVEGARENLKVRRRRTSPRVRARRRRRRRGSLGLALRAATATTTTPVMVPALALLGDVVEDQARGALVAVLEDERDVVEAAADVRVVEEDVAPELGELLRGVPVGVAQPEVADDDGAVLVVHADAEGGAHLVADHLALERERVLLAGLAAELGPARRGHRDNGQVVPLLQLLVLVVRAPEHDDELGVDAALGRDRVVGGHGRARPGSAQGARQRAAPAEALFVSHLDACE